MEKERGLAYKILTWTYERGTLQYDVICALILAFIFFVPRSCFLRKKISQENPPTHVSGSTPAPESQRSPAVPKNHKN